MPEKQVNNFIFSKLKQPFVLILSLYKQIIRIMKRILVLGTLLILGILKVQGQCSSNATFIDQGNGTFDVNQHANFPSGWNASYSIQYGDNTYDWGNVMDTNFVHQFYANDTFIVINGIEAINPLDTNQRCSNYTIDTIIVQNYSCAVEARYIHYNPSNGGSNASAFAAGYYAGTSNVNCVWYIQDALGNTIYTTSGFNLTNILYTFLQNGTYTISYVAQANDTILQTQCTDSISIVINRNTVASCGILIGLQQQNLQGNTVKLTANYNGTFSNRYFLIEGNYFWNTDTITYTFSSGGFHQVGFYGENNVNGQICRDCICPAIPIGGMPGNCNANFVLLEDSINVGQWYAINSSTGFGPPNYLWDFGDGYTSNLAYPNHTYAVPGNYVICLTVSDNYGCSRSMCDSTTALRISQQQAINSLMSSLTVLSPQVGVVENQQVIEEMKLFPNPMQDNTIISFNSLSNLDAKVEIINMLGAVVMSSNISITKGINEIQLLTSDLETGIYVVNITSEKGVIGRLKAMR